MFLINIKIKVVLQQCFTNLINNICKNYFTFDINIDTANYVLVLYVKTVYIGMFILINCI